MPKANVPVNEVPTPPRRLNAAERRAAYKRLVDFVNKKKDRQCFILAAMGLSGGFIEAKTGLSQGQRIYRQRKGNIRLMDYRNGSSPFAKMIMQTTYDLIDAQAEKHLLKEIPSLYEIAELGRRAGQSGR